MAAWKAMGYPVYAAEQYQPEKTPGARTQETTTAAWGSAALDLLANRQVGGLLGIWVFTVVICGLMYWVNGWLGGAGLQEGTARVTSDWRGLVTALYFSFVTATSVGYGDVIPRGAVRALAVAESVMGLLLFGAVISKLVSRRQESLVEDIHRTTFEDRLGRVRTNLHLVLSELQALSAQCHTSEPAPARILARVESAALIFAGELHTVHDLLFRPQQVPEEPVLEGILGSLTAAMQEFAELQRCLAEGAYESAILIRSRDTVARLANEICGDCVPTEYAPALKIWMNRVQELSRKLVENPS